MAIGLDARRATQAPAARTSLGAIGIVALVLMVIGGLNWGLVGLFQYDLVAILFGPMTVITRVIYVLVGLAALYDSPCCFADAATDSTGNPAQATGLRRTFISIRPGAQP